MTGRDLNSTTNLRRRWRMAYKLSYAKGWRALSFYVRRVLTRPDMTISNLRRRRRTLDESAYASRIAVRQSVVSTLRQEYLPHQTK